MWDKNIEMPPYGPSLTVPNLLPNVDECKQN